MIDVESLPPAVARLLQAGEKPSAAVVSQLCHQAESVRPAIQELAASTALLRAPEPRCFAPLHALRLLPEMPHPDNVIAVLQQLPLPLDETSHVAAVRWARDAINIIAEHGPDVLPLLWAWADDESHPTHSRGAAVHAALFIVQAHPATAAEVRRAVSERFVAYLAAGATDTLYMTFLAHAAVTLQLREHYTALMGAYKVGQIDHTLMPAATARQAIYGQSDREPFVPVGFWERYSHDDDEDKED